MDYLTPELVTAPRPLPDDLTGGPRGSGTRGDALYLRSYLLMRTVIGFVGIALPVALLVGDAIFLRGGILPRGSLSAYYHSGMRDVFVGALCATAVFLVTYKVFEHSLDNTLSIVAGLAALGVALFPTGRPGGNGATTPLQEEMGEAAVAAVHYVCAVVFIASLAVISYFFGVRESKRTQQRPGHAARMSPTFWRNFHYACAVVIVLAIAAVAVTKLTGWLDEYSLIYGETVAVVAFGLSWLAKGLELDVLRPGATVSPG